jgi:precorrin-4/cobalt-precorrin-4 C11-methyltransferase
LTIKAEEIINKADIIIYAGSLVNEETLKLAKEGAKIYDSSKMTLEEIFNLIKEAEEANTKIVARIHSGDTSLYSAISEQIEYCEQQGIEYEIIPGVSSFSAAASSLRRELTAPGVSQTVIFTRIGGRTKVPENENLSSLSKIGATLVIFLSIHKIEEVVEKLKEGYALDTPIAVVERASLPDERKILGTLADIAEKVKKAGVRRQALIIVGNVLRDSLCSRSRVYDKRFKHSFRNKKR